jgi:nicotinamide-nucleotide amidase
MNNNNTQKIAILATGDELVWGDTLNTNGQKIAHLLHQEALELGYHLTAGDNIHDIVACLKFLSTTHQVIIIMGGLGPTSDDKTRFALAQWLNLPLIEFEAARAHVQERLSRGNIALNAGNLQQCLFPKNAKLLPNPNGTAVGCEVKHQNIQYFLLPGPPKECLPMFKDHVLPAITKPTLTHEKLLKWLLFGVAESQIAATLEDALKDYPCVLGYRLDWPYVEFKVKTHEQYEAKIEQILKPILASHLLFRHEKASLNLKARLKTLQTPIKLIDKVTGGHLQLTLQHPENYTKLHFFETKDATIGFEFTGLEAYWQQTPQCFETDIKIKMIKNNKVIHQESAQLPYRGTDLVLRIATEWLCFRLLHLIDESHEIIA